MRHNVVNLYGMVASAPSIQKNNLTGEYEQGSFHLIVSNGARDFGDRMENIQYNKPLVMSGNPEQVKIMDTLKVHDMVMVKSVLTTMNIVKNVNCPHCKKVTKKTGTLAFVTPIHTVLLERGVSEEKGIELLKKNCEISNQIFLVGELCRDVDYYHENGKHRVSTYQLAVNRKFFLANDVPESRTDYPYIYTYGEQAFNDSIALKTGSGVLIDGMIRTKYFDRYSKCENESCEAFGKDFKWTDHTLEVIPYAVEYLTNYTTREEYEKMENERFEEINKKLFGNN